MEISRSDNIEKTTTRKKCIVVTVVVVVLVVVALALGLGLGLRTRDDAAPKNGHLLRRIDCYPEARWGRGVVDRGDCEQRGCVYDPDPRAVDTEAPVCFVSADSPLGAGYSLSNTISERPDGFTATLRKNILSESDVSIQPLSGVMKVEYAGENVLRLKVYAITVIIFMPSPTTGDGGIVSRSSVRCP